jgi:autotransporter passenger strand-loop-strand repeat protein
MRIPYQFNKIGAGGHLTVDGPVYGSRGVFTFLRNGSCNQSAMTMRSRFIVSSRVSRMEVYNGGSALNTTVNYGGSVFVRDGGHAENTVVNSNGYLHVSPGGTASMTDVNDYGYIYVSGGLADGVEVHSNARVFVHSGGIVRRANVSVGGSLYGQGVSVSFESCVVSSNGRFDIGNSSGVRAIHTTICAFASMYCYNSCAVEHTTVMSGAYLYVSSGANCTDAVVAAGGIINHHVWGNDELTKVTGTNQYGTFWTSNGTAHGYVLVLNQQHLYHYASAISTVLSSGGTQFVSFGAVSEWPQISGNGRMYLYSSGKAYDAVIHSNGYLYADFHGTAVRAMVSSAGYLYVSNYGRAVNVEVEAGGCMYVSNGGAATSTVLAGTQYVSNAGSVFHTTVNSGGIMYIRYNCAGSGATIENGGSLHVSQNCSYADIVVSSRGWLGVYETCEIASVTVEAGGSFLLSRYCNATSVSVASGGSFHVYSGASAYAVSSAIGAIVTVETGGYIQYL